MVGERKNGNGGLQAQGDDIVPYSSEDEEGSRLSEWVWVLVGAGARPLFRPFDFVWVLAFGLATSRYPFGSIHPLFAFACLPNRTFALTYSQTRLCLISCVSPRYCT